jgi:hypothetical protein
MSDTRRLRTVACIADTQRRIVELLPWSWQPLNGTRARLSRPITESRLVCGF